MKVRIVKEESYPDYVIVDYGECNAKLSDKDIAFIEKANVQYAKAQKILKKAYDAWNNS